MDNGVCCLLEDVRVAGGEIPDRFAGDGSCKPRAFLYSRIAWAFTLAADCADREGKARAKKRVRSLAAMKKAIQVVRTAICDRVILGELSRALHRLEPGSAHLVMEISEKLSLLQEAAARVDNDLVGTDQSMLECLFTRLACIYRDEFGADPLRGVTTSYHDPRGPFVAFVQATYIRLGQSEPLSKAALESGLAIIRKARPSGEK
jgi:hypothetical protein